MEFQVGGASLALWPLIRSLVLSRLTTILREQHDGTTSQPDARPTRYLQHEHTHSFSEISKLILKIWNRDILYISNKSSNTIYNGTPYNQWEQPTAELLGERTVFISTNNSFHPSTVASKIFVSNGAALYSKMNRAASLFKLLQSNSSCVAFIDFLRKRITNIYDATTANNILSGVLEKLILRARCANAEHYIWKEILRRSPVKTILISTACYGNYTGAQVAAQDLGIRTAELQHGMIYSKHHGYNCSKALSENVQFRRHTPSFLLTYGTFWHRYIGLPTTPYPMGNPFFSISFDHNREPRNDAILFALSNEYESFTPMVAAVTAAFPNKKVRIRPHPSCRSALSASSLAQLSGYEVDSSPNLYEAVRRADVIIGTASTSLFESAALGRRCFLKPSFLTDEDPIWSIFEQVNSPEELLEKISIPDCGRLTENMQNSIFARNWQENYTTFINDACA